MSDNPNADNPFAKIDPQMGAAEQPSGEENPFSTLFPGGVAPEKVSGLSSFFSSFGRSALPAAGGLVSVGAGAEAGAAIGSFGGPIGAAAGGLIGGLGGFFLGAGAVGGAQDWALKQAPDNWQEALGQSERQQRLQEQQHPVYSFLGGIAPYALTMSPGSFSTKALNLPEGATTFQKIMANPITSRVFGGAAMGGMELGQEALNGESPDWTKVGISTGFGLIFNKPTKFGEYLHGLGAAPFHANEPTVAQAADLGVVGPGITEATFRGGHEQSDATRTTAHNAAADEETEIGTPPALDLHVVARRLDPETFQQNDELLARRDSLRQFIDQQSNPPSEAFDALASKQSEIEAALEAANPRSPDARNYRAQIADIEAQRQDLTARQQAWSSGAHVDTPEIMLARQHLMDTEHELWDLGPKISAAMRRAADHAGQFEEEPTTAEQPAAQVPEQPAAPAAAEQGGETPPPAPGMVRLFHGGNADPTTGGGRFVTTDHAYARNFRSEGTPNKVWYTDVPADHPEVAANTDHNAVEGTGMKAPVHHFETSEALAKTMKPYRAPGEVAPAAVKSPAAQRAFITADRTSQLVAAGMPREQAEANAHVEAAYYETLAARFGGKLGTAEDLYRERAAKVVGPQGQTAAAPQAAPATPAAAPRPAPPEAPEPAATAPAPSGRTPRPRLRTAEQIARDEGIAPTKANGGKILAIQNQELIALSEWQAKERAANPRPARAPRVLEPAAGPSEAERLGHAFGVETADKTPDEIVAEVAERAPVKMLARERDSQVESYETLLREADKEIGVEPEELTGLGSEGAAAGEQPGTAAEREGHVPEGGGAREPGAEPAGGNPEEVRPAADAGREPIDVTAGGAEPEPAGAAAEPEPARIEAAASATSGMSLVETRHTKTGDPLYVVAMSDRVSSEDFNAMKGVAKQNGGYYSSFRGRGAIPGWTFKTREGAQAFMRAHEIETTAEVAQQAGGNVAVPPPAPALDATPAERAVSDAVAPAQGKGPLPVTSEPKAPPRARRREWNLIGKNADGNPVYEDKDGVRSYTEGGIRSTENVGIGPNGASVAAPEAKASEYQVVQEPEIRNPVPGEEIAEKPQTSAASTGDSTPEGITPEKAPSADTTAYGAANKIFTADKAEAARARIRERLARLNSGFDPEMMLDGLTLAGYHIEAGARSFAAYSRAMVDDLGEKIRPFLEHFYNSVRDYPGFDKSGMDSRATVEAQASREATSRTTAREPETAQDRADIDQLLDSHRDDPLINDIGRMTAEGQSPEDIEESHVGDRYSLDEIEAIAKALDRRGELPSLEEDADGVQGTLPLRDAGAGAEDVYGSEAVGATGSAPPGEIGGGAQDAGGPAGAQEEGTARQLQPGGRAGGGGDGQGASDRVSETGARAKPGTAERPAAQPDADVRGRNFSIQPGDLAETRGPRQKARDNVAAIELAKRLIEEGRPATKAEQAVLVKYTGWGGLKGAFEDSAGEMREGFKDIGAKLKTLLTEEEYKTAERSTQYAHYTAEHVIRSMWDAVRRMGFEGGSVFEPGMGVGHFLGLMPPDLAGKSRYQGIEMDHLTSDIAKLLYPESGVRQADFTRMALPEKAFDLVIGNPPFSDTVIASDPKYRARGFMLHDYFFAKSLDAVRPGGLLGFVTSAGTMNKLDSAAREYLAERAEFAGGVRLPSSAFRQNAGTDVTTDILFFKRRPEGRVDIGEEKPDWTQVAPRSLQNADGATIEGNVNKYFSDHPENVLGEEGFFDKLYKDRYAVHQTPGTDLAADLRAAIDRLPVGIMEPEQTPEQRAALDFSSTERKDGSFYIHDDGTLMQYRDGAGQPVPKRGAGSGGFTAGEMERIQHLIPMRDALRDVFSADLARDDEAGVAARTKLNEHYDRFVEKFGPVNEAKFRYQRPTATQMETLRAEAREEARGAGAQFEEGDFDPSDMIAAKAKPSEIAKARQAARDDAANAGRAFNEGTFDPVEIPDNVYETRPNIKPFMSDPESYRLRSIENYNDATGQASKKDVFFRSILKFDEEPEIRSANDGVLWSMNKFGRFDVDQIAKKMGRERSDVIAELGDAVFKVPGTNDTYQTRDEYLSGDIVSKLETARAEAVTDPDVRRNLPALEAALPPPLPPSAISMNIGMPWIPVDTVKEFVKDHLQLGEPYIKHSQETGTWLVKGDKHGTAPGVPQWGISERGAYDLLADAMNRTPPRIYQEGRDAEGKKVRTFSATLTQAAQDKVDRIKEEFQNWIHTTEGKADGLASIYNDTMNRSVLRQYDGSYLTTPGVASTWSWRPHQQRVVARIVQDGNTYMAHSVGAGKTSAMIGAGMEMRRLGLVKKPVYVVPNHMLGQFTKEFYEQYPTARISVADEDRFHTDRRRQFVANVAQDDLDAVIMTHSSFGKIPISDEFQAHLIQEQIGMLDKAMGDLDPESDRIAVGRLQNQKEKLEQKLSGQGGGDKDQTLTFEQMGGDFLFVDEAHLFRKLGFATKQSGLKGITPEGSNMAFDLYSKVRYLDSQKPGRSAVFASGTPVTNTMGELYSLSRFMQPEALAERGLTHFDSWAQNFGDTKTGLEENAAGGYQPVTRFGQFVNLPELYKMVGQVMDIVTPKQLEQYVTRPTIKGGERQFHMAPRTDILDRYQETLRQRMEAIKARKGPPAKGDDILLSVINDGRHAAIDPRFVEDTQSDPRSKLNMLVQNVARIYRETADTQFYSPASEYKEPSFRGPATQMVFANLGVNGRGPMGFSTYQWIKEALRREGVDPDHLAFIGDYEGTLARQTLFNDMNEGKKRILVGSTQKMGTGVNAQRRLFALHNLDPLWYPADDEQRVGRALRQGNHNPEIEIHDYSTKGTYDSAMWKMMGNKARFIEQFFRGDPELRNMEDVGEASMYEQASAMATTDERMITLTEMKQDLDRARRREAAHDQEQYSLRTSLRNQGSYADMYAKDIQNLQSDIERREDTRGDKFSMLVGGEKFDKRVDASEALEKVVEDRAAGLGKGAEAPVGRIGGFPLIIRRGSGDEIGYSLRMGGGERSLSSTNAAGAIASAENYLRSLEDKVDYAQRNMAAAQQKAEAIKPLIGKKFEGTADIIRLAKSVRELEEQINPPKKEGEEASDGRTLSQMPVGRQTETPEFKRWFGESKVVDAEGKPLVVYHGTGENFDAFSREHLGDNTSAEARNGFFFTSDPGEASSYAPREGGHVVPTFLSLKKPLELGYADHGINDIIGADSKLAEYLNKSQGVVARLRGTDGLILKDIGGVDGKNLYVAFKPEQIKSATGNSGAFDRRNPSILRQGAQGKISLRDSGAIIHLMRTADASTFMHETAHHWLEQMMGDATHEAAPDDLRADAETVRRWLGLKPNADRIPTAKHEKFARTFEQYLREGVAPSKPLASVFAKFKTWLTGIYQTIKGLGAPISEDIRGVFDRMLATSPERTVYAPERDASHGIGTVHQTDAAEAEPHEADAVADRVSGERQRYIAGQPPEIANELATATPAAGPEAAEPAGENGAGAAGSGEVDQGGGQPEPVAPGGGGGAERGDVGKGGGKASPEGSIVSGGSDQRPGAGASTGVGQFAPKPATSFADAEPKLVDKAGNIRVENLTDVADIAQAIHDAADRNDEFRAVRGGMTKGQMLELADSMGLDPSKINEDVLSRMFGGTADLGAKILAARRLVVQSAGIVAEAMKTAAESESDHDIAAMGVAIARHDMIQSALAGVTAEWGRAGSAFHSLLSGWNKAQDINQLLKDNLGRDLFQLKMISKLGKSLDTPGKVSKFLRDAQRRTFGRMVLEYWINGLISGPSTHMTYMVGNTVLAAHKAGPETAAAAGIGALRARFGRTGERVHMGEVGAQFRGALREAPAAAQAAIEAARSGQTTLLPGETAHALLPFQGDALINTARNMTNAPVTWSEVKGDAYSLMQGMRDGLVSGGELIKAGGVAGAPMFGPQYSPLGQIPDIAYRGVNVLPVGSLARLPSRAIAAIHSTFRSMNYSMEINALAYRQAVEEGKTGTDLAARIADLRQNPSDAMMDQARTKATHMTLMGQGGEFVKALQKLTNVEIAGFPFLKFVDPFVAIAANIMDQSLVQRTPVGLLSSEIRADLMGKNGNIAQDTAAAKMLVGTALSVAFGGLAAQGLASGSGPSDPHQSAMWRLAGNQAHSVRVGDIWYDIHKLGPVGMLLSVAADMYDVAHSLGKDEADVVGKAMMHAFTQNILDESFMRGPSDLIKALTDPDRYGAGYVRTFLSSFLPYSVGMAQMARASDPYSRQARTIMDAIRAKVPGLSESLFPRRDIWGEPMPSGDALIAPGVTAIYATKMSTDQVNRAMLDLGISPAPVERSIRNVPLTDEQYDDFARIAGRSTKMRLDAIVRSPDYQSWPKATQHEVIEETLRQSREAARGWMMMKYPDIPREAAKRQIARKTGEPMPPGR